MKAEHTLSLCERKLQKKISFFFSILCAILYSLYIFLFAPLYIYFANDILYMGTVLPELFSILSASVDILVFALAYAVTVYSIYRFSTPKSTRFLTIYAFFICYKNIGNLLMTYMTDGIPSNILPDLLNIGIYLLMELLQLLVVVLISHLILSVAKKREKIRMEAATVARKSYTPSTEFFPFSKILNFKNPIQKALFWVAFVPMSVKVISRIWYDIWFFIQYGLYDGLMDFLWMFLYYSIDILAYGVLIYCLMFVLLGYFHRLDSKIESEHQKVDASLLFDEASVKK